jgi:NDP-sugar pyrophosphorylase family protein
MKTAPNSCPDPKGAAEGLKAVILAGGKGVRLQPFTVNFPKPLVPLGNTPVLEVLMRWLIKYGVTDITLTLGYLAELLKAYFIQRHELVDLLNLRYVEETEPTGTAGSLSLVNGLTDTFIVMNGDLLTDLDLNQLVSYHKQQGAAITIATHTRQVKIDLGVLKFGSDNVLTDYIEKPETDYDVSMGIYVYEPRVLNFIEHGKYLDFPSLVLQLIAAGEKICAFPTDCLWLDIGSPEDYAKAQELFANNEDKFDRG